MRLNLLEHTKKCVDLGALLGAKSLVFGSPKNRKIPEGVSSVETMEIAASFFSDLGDYANNRGCFISLEANPELYGTNFLNYTHEVCDFVRELNSPGVRVNLDIGTIKINKRDYQSVVEATLPFTGHIHISEPMLELVASDVDAGKHKVVAELIKSSGYCNWVSIEMKSGVSGSNLESVKKSIDCLERYYSV